MAKKKAARRGMSRFSIICLICAGVFVVLWLVLLLFVRRWLVQYEASQPKYAAQEIFTRYFEPVDLTGLVNDAQYNAGLASREDVESFLQQTIGSSTFSYAEGKSENNDSARFVVRADNMQVAAINLRRSSEKGPYGLAKWEFDDLELLLDNVALPGRYVTINAPAGTTVTVDGTVLGEDRITRQYDNAEALTAYPDGVSSLPYVTYTLSDLTAVPGQVTVSDAAGNQASVSCDDASHTYTASPVYSAELAAAYSDFVTRAVEGYAGYMQVVPGSSFEGISGYFDPDSSLYRSIRAASADFWTMYAPDRDDFTDVYIGEFYPFAPDLFSCHISLTQLLYRGGTQDINVIDMTVFVHDTGAGYRIFDWQTNV